MKCEACNNVLISHNRCSCTETCDKGSKCWFVEPDTYVPPSVPRFL